jgi:putative transposase
MPRTARLVVPGMPHHITQRGTRRFDVFRDETDRLDYLKMFAESCLIFQLRIVAYCLMTNHVHYIAIPERKDSIRRVFHRVHGTHSKRFNIKHGFVGHLWQERPFSCVLSDSHCWNAIRYVEQNPVRAAMVGNAADYRWSSAAAHCRVEDDTWLALDRTLTDKIPNWQAWLARLNDPETNRFIRECTFTDRPCGDEGFVNQIERAADRDFTRKKPGPKPKDRDEQSLLLDWAKDEIRR